MSKEWVKKEKLEVAFKDMHKIDPTVEKQKIKKGAYKIRLKYKGDEVILGEVMRGGLTKYATVEHNGNVEQFDNYYNAELRATEILRSN